MSAGNTNSRSHNIYAAESLFLRNPECKQTFSRLRSNPKFPLLSLDPEGLERGEPGLLEHGPLLGPRQRPRHRDDGLVGLRLRLELGEVATRLDEDLHVLGDLGGVDAEGGDVRVALGLVVQDGLGKSKEMKIISIIYYGGGDGV